MRGCGWLIRVSVCAATGIVVGSLGCNDADSDPASSQAGAGGQVAGNGGSTSAGGGLVMPMAGTGGSPSAESIEPPLVLCNSGEGGAAGSPAQGGASSDDDDGGAAGTPARDDACVPPPSQCADQNTLVFFTDGACRDGLCEWNKTLLSCFGLCSGNGCTGGLTAN
jgi:hypothetical protein